MKQRMTRLTALLLTGLMAAGTAVPGVYAGSKPSLTEPQRENLEQMVVTTPQEEIAPSGMGEVSGGSDGGEVSGGAAPGLSDSAALRDVSVTEAEAQRDDSIYSSPLSVTAANGRVFAADYTAKCIRVVDAVSGAIKESIALPEKPNVVRVSPDGTKLYAGAGGADGHIYEMNPSAGTITRAFNAGHTPSAFAFSEDGSRLYTANRFSGTLQVIDLVTGETTAEFPVTREPMSMVRAGNKLYVASHLITGSAQQSVTSSDVVCIDLSASDVSAASAHSTIKLLNGSTNVKDMAVSPDGAYVYVSHVLGRYNVATTQADRGWIYNNAVTEIRTSDNLVTATMMLDDLDWGAGNPWGIAATDTQLVSAISGTGELMVIDRTKMRQKIDSVADGSYWNGKNSALKYQGYLQNRADIANDLTFLTEMKTRIKLNQNGPRGVVVYGGTAYTANYFSGSLSAVELSGGSKRSIAFDTAAEDEIRTGERLWNDATIGYQQWQSCASCHPDARVDGLNWDNLNDGIGTPKQARSMLYTFRRGRVMATGIRPDAKVAVRAGLKYIMFNANYPEDQLLKIDAYLQSLEPEPSPLLVDGRLSESAMRGRALFNGEAGCAKCHAGELKGKDTLIYNYTQTGNESRGLLVPPLVEAWRTAPYLCDGRAATVKEVLTTYNPGYAKGNGKHGEVNGLSDSQIDDVCSYVMSLSTEAEALTLDRSSMDFGTAKEGYTSWGAMTATLTNNGAATVTGLALKTELQSFELKLEKTELAEGKSAVVTVTPKPDLPIGLYRETAVIDSASHDSVIVQLTFLVNGEIPLAGSAVVGETLSIGEMAEPTGLKYQWYRGADAQSASPIGGAQERTYVPTMADEGLCLLVKASLDGRILYTSELSEPVRLSGQTTYLRVDGIPKPGQTLTATVRGSSKTYDITWTSGDETLGTGTTYEVTENDVGLVIVATAVCREDGSKLTYRLSAVAPASQAVVSVRVADGSGNALAGCQLSLSTAPDAVLAVTRGDGTAELLLGEGTYTVLAKKESASAEAVITITGEEILAGKAELPITINRGDAYAVTGSFSCAGVYGAKVELIDQAGTVTGLADLRRQKETSFRLEVPAGTYTLQITKPGHLSCTIRRISVTGDMKIPTVLPLTPGKARPGDSTRISFFDLAAMSGAFAGLFRLTDNPDIDGDGMFTAADLGYVRQNYGKTAIDMTYEELIDQGLKP